MYSLSEPHRQASGNSSKHHLGPTLCALGLARVDQIGKDGLRCSLLSFFLEKLSASAASVAAAAGIIFGLEDHNLCTQRRVANRLQRGPEALRSLGCECGSKTGTAENQALQNGKVDNLRFASFFCGC